MKGEERQNFINMLIYKSWHRGSKETDILLGDFAKAQINTLTEQELEVYAKLIEENDWDIYEWILNETVSIPNIYEAIILKIRNFNIQNQKI